MRPRAKEWLTNGLLVLASIAVTLGALELFLRLDSKVAPSAPMFSHVTASLKAALEFDGVPDDVIAKAEAHRAPLTLPDAWRLTRTQTPGAVVSYQWHGALHVEDKDGFRRTEPFPPRRPGVGRVLVVGDSLTYGQGIAEQDTFSALLNKEQWDKPVEFLNLGHPGHQSEDILGVIRRFVPELKPDLVIYTVCINDFLPSGVGQYHWVYPFPLPDHVKDYLILHTKVGALISDLYDATMRRFHIRRDFVTDILSDFDGYAQRFARDVAAMNAIVREAGLPPMIAMVLDQYPSTGNQNYRIGSIAEQALRAAGADVIDVADYNRRYEGNGLNVSRFEGHPNEIAHFVWARLITRHLADHHRNLTAPRKP